MDGSLRKIAILSAITGCFLLFVIWILSVALPIILVELRYQYQNILSSVFHVSDIRGLVFPQFRIDLKGYTSINTVNGITIPRIFVDEPVIYNVDPNDQRAYNDALKHGIAHASGTAFPGDSGLSYFFAHSSTPSLVHQFNAVFYLLNKLVVGDEIYIWHEGHRYDYQVSDKHITTPGDVSFLRQNYDTQTIVLQTCWPPGTTLKRLLVFATRLPTLIP